MGRVSLFFCFPFVFCFLFPVSFFVFSILLVLLCFLFFFLDCNTNDFHVEKMLVPFERKNSWSNKLLMTSEKNIHEV
jgi:hypothetical protein